MGRSGQIRGFTAACVLIVSLTACGSSGNNGQGVLLQESPLPSEQMRGATPATMPLQTQPVPEGNSADSQVTTPKDGEQHEWTTERMRSASPEPMPRVP